MVTREKYHTNSSLLGSNRLIKTSPKHTQYITIEPSFKTDDSLPEIKNSIELQTHQFSLAINSATDSLAFLIHKLRQNKVLINQYKSKHLTLIKSDLRRLKSGRTSFWNFF